MATYKKQLDSVQAVFILKMHFHTSKLKQNSSTRSIKNGALLQTFHHIYTDAALTQLTKATYITAN